MSTSYSYTQKVKDGIAKSLWSGEVSDGRQDQGRNLTGGYNTYEKQYPVRKDDGMRKGTVPKHIQTPQQGRPRSFDPFTLRQLANTEPVQAAMETIISDMRSIPWTVAPLDEDAEPPGDVMTEAERAIADPNPNPEKVTDINEMFLRDAMEVGNLAAIINTNVDGRRAEVIPHDPNTFTVEWGQHRILQHYWQYPHASGSRFGNPEKLDRELVMWGVANPETQRAGFYGHSPVERLQMIINVLGGLVESEVKELEEGMPPGIITLEGDEWSQDDYENFETYWENEVKGEQHKAPYARGKANFVRFNNSYQDLQVLERQQWYNKLVGAVFNVPVSESGLQVGKTNRATDVSIRQKYKQNGLRPWLQLLEDVWTSQYLHRYWSERIKYQFNPGLDLLERKELADIHTAQLQAGLTTINEIRTEDLGKDEVEWGDKPFDLGTWMQVQLGQSQGQAGAGGEGTPGEGESNGPSMEMLMEAVGPDGAGMEQDLQDLQEEINAGEVKNSNSLLAQDQTWLAGYIRKDESGDGDKSIEDTPLRETEDARQFDFQPGEMEDLKEDLEDVLREYILEGVLPDIKERQHLLRDEAVDKNVAEFVQVIEEDVGIEFAQDVADVLTEHKTRQVLDGEKNIAQELEEAGLDVEDLNLDQIRDRVQERVAARTMEITKPISDRLEEDLKGVLEEGWNKGQSIEEIEGRIEDLTDKWQGTDAERLARDQLGKASKEGREMMAAETEDAVGGWNKTWITTGGHSGDGRTRRSHREMHNTTIPRSENFEVNYAYDGGPARVEETYPGDSRYGIQCRCTVEYTPRETVEKAKAWGEDPGEGVREQRIREVEDEQGEQIHQVLLAKEVHPDISRTQAAEDLGISKPTLYNWLECAGLK